VAEVKRFVKDKAGTFKQDSGIMSKIKQAKLKMKKRGTS
jgi:hypothetical protein